MPARRLLISSCLAIYLAAFASLAGQAGERAVANGPVHDGVEVMADIPASLRVRNDRGTDRLGLCVWASAQMMANMLNVTELATLFDDMKKEPGGGWPERVDQKMKALAPNREYSQYIGTSLDFIQEGIDSGRPVCITYGYGEIYTGTIAHMVICVHLDQQFGAVVDNNEPDVVRWMSREELGRRFIHADGYGWAWYILASPPPPPPHN